MSIGGDSGLIVKDVGNAGGWCDVTGQANRPRTVVNLEQIKVIRPLVESVCVEAVLDRRRRNLVVSRDPSFSSSWIGERLDVIVRVLLSRVAGVAIGSRSTLPLSGVALEHAAALPEDHHPLALTLLMVVCGPLTNLFVTCLASGSCL